MCSLKLALLGCIHLAENWHSHQGEGYEEEARANSREEFMELRERWDRLHTLRVALNVAGLALLCLGVLRGKEHR